MKNDVLKDILLQELLKHRKLTRQEFLELHECRTASMLNAINELKSCGLIIEPDRQSAKTGRRSPALILNPNYGAFAGIELQKHKILGTVIDNNGKIISEVIMDFPAGITAPQVPGKLKELIEALRNRQSTRTPPWKGIGFADPGLVDVEKQLPLRAHNVPGWVDIPIGNILKELAKVENTFIVPAVMARNHAEYSECGPTPPSTMSLVMLDTGIGCSFIKDGLLFTGSTSRGMELGHLVITPGGPLCKCGNFGCLEAIAGEHGIRQKISKLLKENTATILKSTATINDLVDAVNAHDQAAEILAAELCEAVASAITILVTMLNPEKIVFSGRLSKINDILLETVRDALNKNCFSGSVENLQLEISALDDLSTARGAALLMRHKFLLPESRLWL